MMVSLSWRIETLQSLAVGKNKAPTSIQETISRFGNAKSFSYIMELDVTKLPDDCFLELKILEVYKVNTDDEPSSPRYLVWEINIPTSLVKKPISLTSFYIKVQSVSNNFWVLQSQIPCLASDTTISIQESSEKMERLLKAACADILA